MNLNYTNKLFVKCKNNIKNPNPLPNPDTTLLISDYFKLKKKCLKSKALQGSPAYFYTIEKTSARHKDIILFS
jgi:hypothetical protein